MAVDQGKAKKILSQSFLDQNEGVNEDTAANMIVKAEQLIKGLVEERDGDDDIKIKRQR